jgi:hypothetical protein
MNQKFDFLSNPKKAKKKKKTLTYVRDMNQYCWVFDCWVGFLSSFDEIKEL